MRKGITTAAILLGMALMPFAAGAGDLALGSASVTGTTVSVPIVLSGDVGGGVSTMDFTFTYDPNVFEPVGVTAGAAASAADKGVQYNLLEPGRCKVVMMGLNQSVVSGGEVAMLKFRRLSTASGATELGIDEPTLSDPNASAIPSKGTTETIDLAGETTGTDQNGTGTNGETPTGNGTETPTTGGTTTDPGKPGVATPGTPVTAPATGGQAPGAAAGGKNVLPGVMPIGGKRPLTGDPKDPAFAKRLQQMARMGDLSQLPRGVQSGVPGADPATLSGQAGTVNGQSGTPNGTPETPTKPTAMGVKRTGKGVGALAMNPAGGPGLPTGPASKAVVPPAAPSSLQRSGSFKWVGVGVIVLALGVLFVLRRRLFS